MTQLQAIRWFGAEVTGEPITVRRNRTEWGCCISEPHPTFYLPKDLTQNDEQDKLFRKDFVARCPLARGFSNPTLSMLHEIGHFYTSEAWLEQDQELYANACGNEHFQMYCEIVATNWAIEWLQDADNRKLAKAFERKFFGRW